MMLGTAVEKVLKCRNCGRTPGQIPEYNPIFGIAIDGKALNATECVELLEDSIDLTTYTFLCPRCKREGKH